MLTKLQKFAVILLLILASEPVGAEWTRYPSGTLAWLHAIYFIDDSKGWIVGSRGTLLATEDGGVSWNIVSRPTQDTIRDVYFSDALHGVLLCEGSIYGSNDPIAYLMVTEDGGKTWQRKHAFDGRDRLVRMFFMNSRFGCAVGEGGSIWCKVENEDAWRKYPLPVRYLMLDGRVLGEKTLVIVGGGGTAIRTDDWGANWVVASTPSAFRSKVNSLFFVDEKSGWAVGAGGSVLFTQNSGQSWTLKTTPVKAELSDVYFSDANSGFAVGDGGTIIRTSDAGSTWIVELTETKHRLEAAAATKERDFAVGFGGTILVRKAETETGTKAKQ